MWWIEVYSVDKRPKMHEMQEKFLFIPSLDLVSRLSAGIARGYEAARVL
jgi:hypothetical protein